ncbi:MAG: hypothetical protein K0S34_403 [Bacillales bacterium]|jgi:N-dimethylarginine dimethylaminohydrolase|nr:hypothetical protein [Bacillales bacterium]
MKRLEGLKLNSLNRFLRKDLVSEPFHDKSLLSEIWGEYWGVTNDLGRIRKILMHRPGKEILKVHENATRIESESVLSGNIIGRTRVDNNLSELPDLEKLIFQHDTLTEILRKEGIDIINIDDESGSWPDLVFTRDLGLVVPGGVIISRPALYLRYGETRLASNTLSKIGMPILGTIQGDGFIEGGSFTLINEKTAVIGRSERISLSGIDQLKNLLSIQNIKLIVVDIPSTIIHLDEAFLLLDRHKALINKSLLPFWFLDELHKLEIDLIHIDPEDHPLSINVLPIAPGKILFPSSEKRTLNLLEQQGLNVIPVDVSEFFKLGGGLHCLTLPLIRDYLN